MVKTEEPSGAKAEEPESGAGAEDLMLHRQTASPSVLRASSSPREEIDPAFARVSQQCTDHERSTPSVPDRRGIPMGRITELADQWESAKKTAREYVQGLSDREKSQPVTDAELEQARALAKAAEDAGRRYKSQKDFQALTDGLSGADEGDGMAAVYGLQGKAAGVVSNTWGQKTMRALQDAARVRSSGERVGMKSLLGGTVDVPVVIAQPVELPSLANNILQIVPTQAITDNELSELGNGRFDYLVQSERTNNADAVADGDVKPTSHYDWVEKTDRLRVYAHLVDSLPERFLEDNSKLQTMIVSEMLNGLMSKIEEDVLNGPVQATGVEQFTGIMNTSGVQTVDGAGMDLIDAMSNAMFSLSVLGEKPNAWVIHPLDLQRLLLLREDDGTGPLLFNSGRTQLSEFLGNIDIVQSTRMPRGTVLLGDFTYCRLLTRNAAAFEADKSGDLFERNQVRFRLEGRYGFTVTRPSAFVKLTLPAAA